jgi:hypothetical protein
LACCVQQASARDNGLLEPLEDTVLVLQFFDKLLTGLDAHVHSPQLAPVYAVGEAEAVPGAGDLSSEDVILLRHA